MSTWERVNRLELEIQQLRVQLELARRVAVNATQVCAICGGELAHVPFRGEAT